MRSIGRGIVVRATQAAAHWFPCTVLCLGLVGAGAPVLATDRGTLTGQLVPVTGETSRSVDLAAAFAKNAADLTEVAREQLDELGATLAGEKLAPYDVGVYGNTDASGAADYNLTLSQARAEEAVRYVVAHFGFEATRYRHEGYVEERFLDGLPPNAATSLPEEHREVQLTLSQARRVVEESARFEELLGRPFSPDEVEESVGWTDLHYAALLDLPGIVAELIGAGVAVDVRVKDGMYFGDNRTGAALNNVLAALGYWDKLEGWVVGGSTPLMIAARLDARDAAEALLAGGADAHAQDTSGITPLHWAAWGDARETAEWLVANGADIRVRDDYGNTPLHWAARGAARETAEWLVANGADIMARDDYGDTPLHEAAYRNARETAEWLVANGADIMARDDYGETPLHDAALVGAYETAKWLLANGADVNAKDSGGATPLGNAIAPRFRGEGERNEETEALLRLLGGKTGEELK